jgi:acyl carrier protein
MSALEQLKQAFVDVLGIDPATSPEQIVYGKTPGWDSVAHMALIAQIESRFDIMLDTNDLIGVSSFGKAREIVGKYGISFDA